MVHHTYRQQFDIWGGIEFKRLYNINRSDGYFSLGGSWDPIYLKYPGGNGLELGLYVDTGGWAENHSAYKFYGGGIEARQYLYSESSREFLNPYIGAGYGYYETRVELYNTHTDRLISPRFFAGLQLSRSFFIEGSYDYFGKHNGRDLSGLGAEVGFRF